MHYGYGSHDVGRWRYDNHMAFRGLSRGIGGPVYRVRVSIVSNNEEISTPPDWFKLLNGVLVSRQASSWRFIQSHQLTWGRRKTQVGEQAYSSPLYLSRLSSALQFPVL